MEYFELTHGAIPKEAIRPVAHGIGSSVGETVPLQRGAPVNTKVLDRRAACAPDQYKDDIVPHHPGLEHLAHGFDASAFRSAHTTPILNNPQGVPTANYDTRHGRACVFTGGTGPKLPTR